MRGVLSARPDKRLLQTAAFPLPTPPIAYLAEFHDPVGPKRDQAGPPRAGLDALHRVVGGRVGPEQVHEDDAPVLHGQRALQSGDLVDVGDGPPDAAVHAQDAVLDQGGQGQVVEQSVEAGPRPDPVRVAQAFDALQAEAEQGVDVGGLQEGGR